MKNDAQENLISRYLLGELPETERVALEDRYFADSETFDRVWEAENRLVDDYVRGRLSLDDREKFEAHYLASPVHLRRVETARNLLAAADEAAPERAISQASPSLLEKRRPSLHSPARQLALTAAAILFLAGGLWLISERARLRGELARMQAENAALQNQAQELARRIKAEQNGRNEIAAELDRLRKTQTEPPQPPGPTPRASLKIFSFALSPISVRGGASQSINLPAAADLARLQLSIPSGDWIGVNAVIQSAERRTVWSGRQIKPRAGQVMIDVPAARLPFNDYILTLSGVNRAGQIEEINRYSFRVRRD